MKQEAARTTRIEARIAPDALTIIRRAAELQGRSLSDFVVTAAQDAAYRTIEAIQVVRLSVEDQRLFADAIINPPEPDEALRHAARLHAEHVEMR